MSAELKVTMTTDELVEEVRRAKDLAWAQGFQAGTRWAFADNSDAPPHSPYEADTKEAA